MNHWASTTSRLRQHAGSVLTAFSVPQGYTLTQAGTMALMIGHRRYPGLLGIWAFVIGAGLAFTGLALATGAGSRPITEPSWPRGLVVYNMAASVAVCGSGTCAWWVPSRNWSFLVAGAAGVWFYTLGVTALLFAADRSVHGDDQSRVEK